MRKPICIDTPPLMAQVVDCAIEDIALRAHPGIYHQRQDEGDGDAADGDGMRAPCGRSCRPASPAMAAARRQTSGMAR